MANDYNIVFIDRYSDIEDLEGLDSDTLVLMLDQVDISDPESNVRSIKYQEIQEIN